MPRQATCCGSIRELPRDQQPSVKRAIAIYGDRLYVPTSDVHVVALDVKNGQVVWDQAIGDRKDGFGLTGGPLVGGRLWSAPLAEQPAVT
jgi:glucose dehydrogenase